MEYSEIVKWFQVFDTGATGRWEPMETAKTLEEAQAKAEILAAQFCDSDGANHLIRDGEFVELTWDHPYRPQMKVKTSQGVIEFNTFIRIVPGESKLTN